MVSSNWQSGQSLTLAVPLCQRRAAGGGGEALGTDLRFTVVLVMKQSSAMMENVEKRDSCHKFGLSPVHTLSGYS